jgi:glycogenin glucosyltransferase
LTTSQTTSTMSFPQPEFAFVTLLNSSSYLPGALVLAHSLRDLHPQPRTVEFHTVCLVTPETVDVESIKQLRSAFDVVIGVEVITSGAEGQAGLQLMGELFVLGDDV